MSLHLDIKKVKLHLNHESSMNSLEANIIRVRKLVKKMMQPHWNMQPLLDLVDTEDPILGKHMWEEIRKVFVRAANNNLAEIRKLGCQLGPRIPLHIRRKLRTAVRKIYENQLLTCIELTKTVTDFELLTAAFVQLNQFIMDTAILFKSVLYYNIQKLKTE
jgi:hypothetical protein